MTKIKKIKKKKKKLTVCGYYFDPNCSYTYFEDENNNVIKFEGIAKKNGKRNND